MNFNKIKTIAGFTLVEMLVATFVFTILGVGLITMMRQGNNIWQENESVKNSHDRAVNVITQIQRDLQNIITDKNNGGRILVGRDPIGRTFFVFTKFLDKDIKHPIFKFSGRSSAYLAQNDTPWYPLTGGELASGDGHYYYPKGMTTQLLPSGGKAEVAYVFSPYPRISLKLRNGDEVEGELRTTSHNIGEFISPDSDSLKVLLASGVLIQVNSEDIVHQKMLGCDLYRSTISPIGAARIPEVPGSGSLFTDYSRPESHCQQWMDELRPILDDMDDKGIYSADTLGIWLDNFTQDFNLKYIPFSSGIIYVGLQYWDPGQLNGRNRTVSEYASLPSWRPTEFGEIRMQNSNKHKATYSPPLGGAIRLTVTAISTQGAVTVGKLRNKITSSSTTLEITGGGMLPSLDSGFPFVLVGNEWIYYENLNGKTVTNCRRGMRSTFPTNHPAGTPVYWGTTMRKVIHLGK